MISKGILAFGILLWDILKFLDNQKFPYKVDASTAHFLSLKTLSLLQVTTSTSTTTTIITLYYGYYLSSCPYSYLFWVPSGVFGEFLGDCLCSALGVGISIQEERWGEKKKKKATLVASFFYNPNNRVCGKGFDFN